MSEDHRSTEIRHTHSEPLRQDVTLAEQERLTQWQLFECLACAAMGEKKIEAWAVLRETREQAFRLNLYTLGFATLYDAVAIELTWRFRGEALEYGRYEKFVQALPQLIPGAKIIPRPSVKSLKRPDFFIERDGLISCIEIKTGTFNNRHVTQLKTYMETYVLKTGYAVAPKLSGTLYPGMMFLQWP